MPHPVHVEQDRIKCACVRADAYECVRVRYQRHMSDLGTYDDEDPCECMCHDADEPDDCDE